MAYWPIALALFCLGAVLLVLAVTSLPLFVGSAVGGLVGCGLAGLYCCCRDRRKRRP